MTSAVTPRTQAMFLTSNMTLSVTGMATELLSNIANRTLDGINGTTMKTPDGINNTTVETSFYYWEESMTKETYDRIRRITRGIAAPTICLGIITNLLSVATFLRMRRSVTTTYFILSSVIDVCHLAILSPDVFISLANPLAPCYYYLSLVGFYSTAFAIPTKRWSICVTMLISVDRCFVLAFPVKARALAHWRRPRLYTLVAGVCTFIMRLDRLLKYRMVWVERLVQYCCCGGYMWVQTDLVQQYPNLFLYLNVIFFALCSMIPLIVSVTASVFLLLVLSRISKSSKSLESSGPGPKNDVTGHAQREELEQSPDSATVRGVDPHPTPLDTATTSSPLTDSDSNQVPLESLSFHASNTAMTVGADSASSPPLTSAVPRQGRQGCSDSTPPPTVSASETQSTITARQTTSSTDSSFFKIRWQQSVSVLVYTAISTLLASPDIIMTVITFVWPNFHQYPRDSNLTHAVVFIFQMLDVISSAVNFYVYFATGSVFRAELRKLLGHMLPCCRKGS